MIATILDYGAGNLHSLTNALRDGDIDVRVEVDPIAALATDLLVLPGVGAFSYASEALSSSREPMRTAIVAGLPTIGICLGMQLLFERSDEGPGDGLGVLQGPVTRLTAHRVPHIGWNTLDVVKAGEVARDLDAVYYANSFACRPRIQDDVVAWTTHEQDRFPAIVRRGRMAGVQFHPEKSQRAGVQALRAMVHAVVSA